MYVRQYQLYVKLTLMLSKNGPWWRMWPWRRRATSEQQEINEIINYNTCRSSD